MSRTAVFRQIVRDHMRPAAATVAPDANCAETVARMAAGAADCALVIGSGREIKGIVTEQDVVRRIAYRHPGETPVTEVMTAPVHVVNDTDYLYHAIARMRRAGLRHMPVVDAAQAAVGTLALDQALAAAARTLLDLVDRLTHEGTLDGLGAVKAAQVEVASALFDDTVSATEIQGLLGDINLDIHRRAIDLALATMRGNGWGDPPLDYCTIVMGSGGRGESFLFPDQDNGFILADYDDDDHARVDAYFIELAEHMTRTLDAVGFPLCRGHVMATNPLWRKSLSQWRQQISLWMRRRSDVTVRLSDIFFDFRAADGLPSLAAELRDHVTRVLARSPAYIRDMYTLQAEHKVALGLFGRLLTERDEHGTERLNLKYNGTLPLVEGVRLLALGNGVPETATLARIDALHGKGVLDADDRDYLGGAFRLITDLMLRQQIADFRAGRAVGNWVPLATLSRRERDMLADGFGAIEKFRERLRGDITGDIF